MSGSKAPARWPNYALWALEDVTADLLEIDRLARQVQEALRADDKVSAALLLGDIRGRALEGRETLGKSKRGER